MASKSNPIDGLPIDLSWQEVDPTDWRSLPDSDSDLENDEEEPTPEYITSLLGFDPDDLSDDESTSTDFSPEFLEILNVFCPTGPGGGVDPTCSPSLG